MSDDKTALAPVKAPRAVGGFRATLALLVSLIALGASGYVSYQQFVAASQAPAPVAAGDGGEIDDLKGRVRSAENAASQLSGVVDSLKNEVSLLAQSVRNRPESVPDAKASAETDKAVHDLQAKLDDLTKDVHALRQEVTTEMGGNLQRMKAFAALEEMHHKMRLGARFADDFRKVEPFLSGSGADSGAVQALAAYSGRLPVSDVALRDELRPLANEMLAKEKMDGANGFFDKVVIQLQKLVSIRPKEGSKVQGSAIADKLNDLQAALDEQAWSAAVTQAEALAAAAPKDYAAWMLKLRARSEAEKALAALQDALTGAPAAVPPPAPVATPAAKTPAAPASQE